MKKNILIIDEFEPSLMEILREANISFEYAPYLDRAGLKEIISNYSGLVVRSKTNIDKEIIDLGDKLTFIARGGSGMDNIDSIYAKTKNIHCLNAPEGNRNAVAEHSIGFIIALITNLVKGNNEVNEGKWDREGNRGIELSSIKAGLIGYGNVGSLVAKKLNALGIKVLVHDKYKTGFGTELIKEVSLLEIKEVCNLISLHIPLTQETNSLVDTQFIDEMKNPFYLINTSRGEICKTTDLLYGLNKNKIMGLGLDVLDSEKKIKLSDIETSNLAVLKSNEKVIITPHVAGWTHESYQGISSVLANKIKELLTNSEYFASEVLINIKN